MSTTEIRELIDQVEWFHSFEIVPGIMTPGVMRVDANAGLNKFGLDDSLEGMRILEVGTWDGPYAFELEARGADVVATDIQDPDSTGFNVARRILNSNVQYVRTSVYDLTKHLHGQFDAVLFKGVYYHLKYPLQAFEQINAVLKDKGLLLFEGECFSYYAETTRGKKIRNRLLMALVANSDVPICLFYSGSYRNDASNWHVPNIACLSSWLNASRFEVTTLQTTAGYSWRRSRNGLWSLPRRIARTVRFYLFSDVQRAFGTAVKLGATPLREHRLVQRKSSVTPQTVRAP